ncbi:class I SAM-dependent rRNA methyltransferase [uncultured Enterococcus sp.]|uniref:class I SAM-dependent rRNA methyltransferase n=1 Tax=uncultured Enterococcus sp. TaxID=167972 RepID=UPI0025E4CCAE|nr:class I SAM-dependent rRNA methyltransferase [uncultured Enterococcus sp.]
MTINVTTHAAKRIKKGYPLLQQEDLVNQGQKSTWDIVMCNQQILGYGYLGEQHKGVGWMLAKHPLTVDQTFFKERFAAAKAKRSAYFYDEQTTAFRLINGEGDQLGGLIIDQYATFAVISWYNETMYEKKIEILAALNEVFPDIIGIYEKIRFQSTLPESQHVYGQEAPEPLLIKENGITYATYLNEGLMTGIFLDQREVRGRLASGLATGKRVLNMFSYTGAFSVAAAMGGARETTSVDLANRSRPKTQEQFEVNGLDPHAQSIVVMDTFEYFKYATRKQFQYDLIILDPPSFARNKKRVFSVAKNYGDLIEQSMPILAKDGYLIASTNAANVSLEKFEGQIEQAFTNQKRQFKKIATYRLPEDFAVDEKFSEGDYLKVILYQCK